MNTKIEENLVWGLTRIFSEYGWTARGGTLLDWDTKLASISFGLHHGQALDYKTHLSMIINARQKDHNWGLFASEYVQGIHTLLVAYAENNDLFNKEREFFSYTQKCREDN